MHTHYTCLSILYLFAHTFYESAGVGSVSVGVCDQAVMLTYNSNMLRCGQYEDLQWEKHYMPIG